MTSKITSEIILETINTNNKENYEGAFFYSLAPKVQLSVLQLLKNEILFEDCIGVFYYTALNFELSKYVGFLRKGIKAYIDNFDAGLMDRKMDL